MGDTLSWNRFVNSNSYRVKYKDIPFSSAKGDRWLDDAIRRAYINRAFAKMFISQPEADFYEKKWEELMGILRSRIANGKARGNSEIYSGETVLKDPTLHSHASKKYPDINIEDPLDLSRLNRVLFRDSSVNSLLDGLFENNLRTMQ